MNDLLNALMSLQLPFALIPTLTFTTSAAFMGEFRNGTLTKIGASLLSMVVISINLYFVSNFVHENLPSHWAVYVGVALFGLLYLGFNLYLLAHLLVVFGCTLLLQLPFVGPHLKERSDRVLFSDSSQTDMSSSPDIVNSYQLVPTSE